MRWETPKAVEVSLACEICSYANAELSLSGASEALPATLMASAS